MPRKKSRQISGWSADNHGKSVIHAPTYRAYIVPSKKKNLGTSQLHRLIGGWSLNKSLLPPFRLSRVLAYLQLSPFPALPRLHGGKTDRRLLQLPVCQFPSPMRPCPCTELSSWARTRFLLPEQQISSSLHLFLLCDVLWPLQACGLPAALPFPAVPPALYKTVFIGETLLLSGRVIIYCLYIILDVFFIL